MAAPHQQSEASESERQVDARKVTSTADAAAASAREISISSVSTARESLKCASSALRLARRESLPTLRQQPRRRCGL